ncbi:STAS/SEC14 domain-containing protein [Sorangium sp. So ce1078]|uniref:STAS/SEC14 domain-containing protein n=1 Tax=Sorangium sp. So ce1078 TaxID=3133329 RepID=UPI003F60BCEE
MHDSDPRDGVLELREEPDGILHITVDGDLSEEIVRSVAAASRRVAESGREVLVLTDVSRMKAIPHNVRKLMASGTLEARHDAVAIVGASFSVRVVAMLTARSLSLLGLRSYPVELFATEAEARAWLLARRKVIQGGPDRIEQRSVNPGQSRTWSLTPPKRSD